MRKIFFERSKGDKARTKKSREKPRTLKVKMLGTFNTNAKAENAAASSSSSGEQNLDSQTSLEVIHSNERCMSSDNENEYCNGSLSKVQEMWLASVPFDTVCESDGQSNGSKRGGRFPIDFATMSSGKFAKSPEMSDYFENERFSANVFSNDSKLLRKLFVFKEKDVESVKAKVLTDSIVKARKSLHYSQMFAYLSKKLDMPEGSKVTSVAWSGMDGYLACGCGTGLVKVLKIEVVQPCSSSWAHGYLAAQTTIAKNQTLTGHTASIVVIDWNQKQKKLTTTDKKGLTIVWKLCRGTWCEEMVHNREGFAVQALSWSYCGTTICIVYQDGGVMVGSSDGKRLWGYDSISDTDEIVGTAWEPNGSHIVFVTARGTLLIYGREGKLEKTIETQDCVYQHAVDNRVVHLRWFGGSAEHGLYIRKIPSLALVWKSNVVVFYIHLNDKSPIAAQTCMTNTCGSWSPNGEFFAVGGTPLTAPKTESGKASSFEQIDILSPFGTLLQTIKLPGSSCVSLSWDALSLRLAVGVDENIYFANVRPCYLFCMLSNQLVIYSFNRPSGTACVGFWNVDENRLSVQEIPGKVVDIKGNDTVCALLSLAETGCYNATIINSRGDPVDSITIVTIDPFMINLTDSVLVAVSKNAVSIWRYQSKIGGGKPAFPRSCSEFWSKQRMRSFHIDDSPAIIGDSSDDAKLQEPTSDPVNCADARCQMLIVCRESGKLQVYSLPHGALMNSIDTAYEMSFQPSRLWLNTDGSQVAMIDKQGHLSVCSLGSASIKTALARKMDRKDVWSLIWAKDHPNLICVMEKTKMYVIRNGESEEPVLTSAYLASFKDLTVTSVLVDELMFNPEKPRAELIITKPTQTLTEAQKLITTHASLATLEDYVKQYDHVTLWQFLGNESLKHFELELAESSFAKANDYSGISFTKKLGLIKNEDIREAEIALYFNDYERAAECYESCDRRDLCREMWNLLGDWKKLHSLTARDKSSDTVTRELNLGKGDACFHQGKWSKAGKYYEIAGSLSTSLEAYLLADDFGKLSQIADQLRDGDPILGKLAQVFTTRGLCSEAVSDFRHHFIGGNTTAAEALVKLGDQSKTKVIEIAIQLSHWDFALELAETCGNSTVETLLVRYIGQLLSEGKALDGVNVLIKSQKFYAAGKFLVIIALRQLQDMDPNLTQIKKLFIHAAKLLQKKTSLRTNRPCSESNFSVPAIKHAQATASKSTPDILFERVLPEAMRPSKETYDWMREVPWRGAEAIHFFIIAQRLLHSGKYTDSLRISVQVLRDFYDILGKERVNSLIALAASNTPDFFYASMAFMELENMDEEYTDLASDLFSNVLPASDPTKPNQELNLTDCHICGYTSNRILPTCPECSTKFKLCANTGQILTSKIWTCRICNYGSDLDSVKICRFCPFCHSERVSSVENLAFPL